MGCPCSVPPIRDLTLSSGIAQSQARPIRSLAPPPNLAQSQARPIRSLAPPPNLAQSQARPIRSLAPPPNLAQSQAHPIRSLAPPPNLARPQAHPIQSHPRVSPSRRATPIPQPCSILGYHPTSRSTHPKFSQGSARPQCRRPPSSAGPLLRHVRELNRRTTYRNALARPVAATPMRMSSTDAVSPDPLAHPVPVSSMRELNRRRISPRVALNRSQCRFMRESNPPPSHPTRESLVRGHARQLHR
jgi:hypothetical protein